MHFQNAVKPYQCPGNSYKYLSPTKETFKTVEKNSIMSLLMNFTTSNLQPQDSISPTEYFDSTGTPIKFK